MGLWNMKNRGDMQKMIVSHIDEIDNTLNSLNAELTVGHNVTLVGLLEAKSTALLALTQTLPKEK
jgi:hypothetical protein